MEPRGTVLTAPRASPRGRSVLRACGAWLAGLGMRVMRWSSVTFRCSRPFLEEVAIAEKRAYSPCTARHLGTSIMHPSPNSSKSQSGPCPPSQAADQLFSPIRTRDASDPTSSCLPACLPTCLPAPRLPALRLRDADADADAPRRLTRHAANTARLRLLRRRTHTHTHARTHTHTHSDACIAHHLPRSKTKDGTDARSLPKPDDGCVPRIL